MKADSNEGRTVFEGRRVSLRVVSVTHSDGTSAEREVVVHPGAVVILPVLGGERIVMIRNHRFAVDEVLWELPAGTLEPGEPVEDCAGRELREETGYRAGRLTRLATYYTSPGICTERMHAFVAEDLTHVGQALEPGERIEVEPLAVNLVRSMLLAGDIADGKTIATLGLYLLGRTG